MKSEDIVQAEIRINTTVNHCHLWRNNTGVLKDITGRPVRYGLANDSKKLNDDLKSSDLIGLTSIVITPDMVGKMIGVFTAVEVKEEGWKFNLKDKREVAQQNYINLVRSKGGFAGFAQSVDDFRKIIGK